ncbi:MAG TPA: hypothetical protein VKH83_05460 [Methylomirabilota bacterium]|nr:hypothetical protein [Methylomirabilota bacterium]
MERWKIIGTSIIAISTLSGAALAASPTKADTDFCNGKAAQTSKAGGSSGAGTAKPAPGGSPSASNPTGGRVTDSSQPGTPPSALGMAPAGETNQAYRQAYLACLEERTK